MNQNGHARCSALHALVLCVGLWGAAGKSGNAIAQPVECNQTDTTISCCLKKNPGQYERCGAVAPRQAPKQGPKRAPKDAPEPVAPLPDPSPEGRKERERKCRDYWNQCIAMGGEYEKRGQHGQTICRACYERCVAEGYWPESVNDFQCLGGF